MLEGDERFAREWQRKPSPHIEQLDIEHECRVRWYDAARAAGTIAEVSWNHERTSAANLHAGDALVPPLDDHARPKAESKWLAPISGAVELLAMLIGSIGVVQPPGVVNGDLCTRRRRGAATDLGIRDLEF